ncbi:MAG: hypothetical protein JWR69_1943 [Pedosphaera sp.]|nr:hypothetical protein [Pedosphaera sp.]
MKLAVVSELGIESSLAGISSHTVAFHDSERFLFK